MAKHHGPKPPTHDPAEDDLKTRIHTALGASDASGITCDLCNDASWWTENGFTAAERQDACGPAGINCPGFGGHEGGG